MRTCKSCGKQQEITEFYSNVKCVGGKISTCRTCCRDTYRSSKLVPKRESELVSSIKAIEPKSTSKKIKPEITITRSDKVIETTWKRVGYA